MLTLNLDSIITPEHDMWVTYLVKTTATKNVTGIEKTERRNRSRILTHESYIINPNDNVLIKKSDSVKYLSSTTMKFSNSGVLIFKDILAYISQKVIEDQGFDYKIEFHNLSEEILLARALDKTKNIVQS